MCWITRIDGGRSASQLKVQQCRIDKLWIGDDVARACNRQGIAETIRRRCDREGIDSYWRSAGFGNNGIGDDRFAAAIAKVFLINSNACIAIRKGILVDSRD